VQEAPELKPLVDALVRKSSATSTPSAPSGTLQWRAYMSTSSRCQGMGLPAAVIFKPEEIGDGPGGAVLAGDPFGIEQRQWGREGPGW